MLIVVLLIKGKSRLTLHLKYIGGIVMEEDNLVKEEQETEEVKEAIEIKKAPKVKKEKKLGFLNFLLGNIVDLIAVIFLSMVCLVVFGLVIKLFGLYVKEILSVYLITIPVVALFYNTILQTKMRSTFGMKILGLKLTK